MPHRVELVDDLGRLGDIASQWAQLHAAAGGGPFSSADWLAAWAAAYGGQGAAPRIGLAWSGERLVAGMALGFRRGPVSGLGPRVGKLAMLCDERAGFHEILALPGAEGQAAVAALLEGYLAQGDWALADLNPMLGSAALDQLAAQARARGLAVWRREEVRRAVCDLSDGWQGYLDRRSGNFRKSIRVARKRVAAEGGTLRILRGGEPDADSVLARALAVSARCWKARMGTDIGSNPQVRTFMTQIWSRFSARQSARILLLSIGGRDAASCFLLRAGSREYGFITDFDEDFAALSPGRVIVSQALETAAADGVAVFDMMRLTPFWERFADEIQSFDRLRLCRRFGLAWLWLSVEERARPLGRELRKRYRRRSHTRVAFKDRSSEREHRDEDA